MVSSEHNLFTNSIIGVTQIPNVRSVFEDTVYVLSLTGCDKLCALSPIRIGSIAAPLRSRLIRTKYLTVRARSDDAQYI